MGREISSGKCMWLRYGCERAGRIKQVERGPTSSAGTQMHTAHTWGFTECNGIWPIKLPGYGLFSIKEMASNKKNDKLNTNTKKQVIIGTVTKTRTCQPLTDGLQRNSKPLREGLPEHCNWWGRGKQDSHEYCWILGTVGNLLCGIIRVQWGWHCGMNFIQWKVRIRKWIESSLKQDPGSYEKL